MHVFFGTRRGFTGVLLLVLAGCHGGGGSSGGSSGAPTPPTAVAGSAQTVNKRAGVTLDGSGSNDAQGLTLTYAWSQTAGTTVSLSNPATAKPTFTAPAVSGALTFSLVVNNGQMASQPATVSITVADRAPIASAPAATNVTIGTAAVLDGSASSDPDQDPLTYTWTQTSGPTVSLTATAGTATFSAPSSSGTLVFSLTVNDGEMSSAAVTETVNVVQPTLPPPVVSAGADITVVKRAGVSLQAVVISSSGRPLTYRWTQIAGTSVTLQDGTTATPSFVAPSSAGDLKFSLTATDGNVASSPSTVTVTVRDRAPIISSVLLPPDPRRNDQITATAVVSDPDNDPLTSSYVWTRNGTVVQGATTGAYPLGNQAKGDVISVTVTVSDGDLSASGSASTTIADTAVVLTGSPPTTALYGVPVSFTVTAVDVDGDPTGPIEVEYAPAGFTVSTGGQVAWTPGGPMFDRAVANSWSVRLRDQQQVRLGGTITVSDVARKQPLVRTNIGIPVGNNALDVQDFDGNGTRQVLVGTYRSLYLLGWHANNDYQQTWVYPFDASPGYYITAVASGDVDGDGHREIFFSAGPTLVELDGVTRREVARYGVATSEYGTAPPGPFCMGIRYADIDNDGKGELICLARDSNANGTLLVLDAETLQPKWQSATAANMGTSLAIGHLYPGSALQIVTSGGYVLDGATHQVRWAYGPGFGTPVDVGDVTGDGLGKIVGVNGGVMARVFDPVLQSPVWEIPLEQYAGIGALKVANLDGASPDEIIVGDGQWGSVYVYRYDGNTHTSNKIAQIAVQGDGVSAIGVGDVDGNGQMELVYGSDYVSSGRDFLTVASWTPSPATLWSGPLPSQLDGAFYGAKMARLAPNSKRLMFMTPSTDSGYAGPRLVALDPATGDIGVSNALNTYSQNSAFDVADVLGTGLDQMLLGANDLGTNYFAAYDFAQNLKVWSSATTNGGGRVVVHADLNGDGIDDLVGLTFNGYVYVEDAAHQSLIWSSTGLGAVTDIAVADLDGDSVAEILVTSASGVIEYKKSGNVYLQAATYPVFGSNLLVADTDGNGTPEVYVLTGFYPSPSSVYQLDNKLTLLRSFDMPNATTLYLEKSPYPRKNLVIGVQGDCCSGGRPSLVKIVDPNGGTLIWQSPPLVGWVAKSSLEFVDLDGDGQLELTLGTGAAMYVTR